MSSISQNFIELKRIYDSGLTASTLSGNAIAGNNFTFYLYIPGYGQQVYQIGLV